MKIKFQFTLALLSLLLIVSASAQAQDKTAGTASQPKAAATPTPAAPASTAAASAAITANTSPIDLARAALAAQGGEKFRNLKSVVVSGSVDLYAPNSTVPVAGKFAMVLASGDRYRLDVVSPVVKFMQIHTGQQSYSSIPNIQTPNPSKFGFGVLTKFDQQGYVVSALPDKKKLRAFRITDPEGNTTDFFVDPATGRVMSFSVPFQGGTFGFENKTFKEIDGVLVATSFTQRFETQQGAFFADFKVKEKDIQLNIALEDDVFAIPGQ
ncbi:MAG TPA: hypothetical protein VGB17_16290 [Pyrinomonadaceae bacterium]|jgi:hypothetical protein